MKSTKSKRVSGYVGRKRGRARWWGQLVELLSRGARRRARVNLPLVEYVGKRDWWKRVSGPLSKAPSVGNSQRKRRAKLALVEASE
jgi:hypothetical protein